MPTTAFLKKNTTLTNHYPVVQPCTFKSSLYERSILFSGRQTSGISFNREKKYRGILLPGSEMQQSRTTACVITIEEFQSPLFRISHHLFEIFSNIKFSIYEIAGLRLEALLSGEMLVAVNGEKRKFKAGELTCYSAEFL